MDTGHLTIVIDVTPFCPIIVATGELDAASVPGAAAYIGRQIALAPGRAWLFDVSGLEFVDSSGLQMLLMIQREISRTGSLSLLDPSDRLRRLLTLTGLDIQFVLISSEPTDLLAGDPLVRVTEDKPAEP